VGYVIKWISDRFSTSLTDDSTFWELTEIRQAYRISENEKCIISLDLSFFISKLTPFTILCTNYVKIF
jgi:hypothetical protein